MSVRQSQLPPAVFSTPFDEQVIQPSPERPFEIAPTPVNDALQPCEFCARRFSAQNLERHVVICQKLTEKPRRAAFNAITQRLAHVAQEAAVRPVIQRLLQERPPVAPAHPKGASPRLRLKAANTPAEPEHAAPQKAPRNKKRSPFRLGHVGTELFNETQRGLTKCPLCERCFQDKSYERHHEFCKQQQAAKDRTIVKEDSLARTDLLLRRVKYRPPALRLASRRNETPPVRKVVSAYGENEPPSTKAAPLTGSKSAMATVNTAATSAKSPKVIRPVKVSLRDKKPKESPDRPIQPLPKHNILADAPDFPIESRERSKKNRVATASSRRTLESAGDSAAVSNRKVVPPKSARKSPMEDLKPTEAHVSAPPAAHLVITPLDANFASDPFLSPAVSKVAVGLRDRQRLFERIGGTYRARHVDNPVSMADILGFHASVSDRRSTFTLGKVPEVSPKSDSGMSGSATFRSGSSLKGDPTGELCNKCGKPAPIPEAIFCCHCGSLTGAPGRRAEQPSLPQISPTSYGTDGFYLRQSSALTGHKAGVVNG